MRFHKESGEKPSLLENIDQVVNVVSMDCFNRMGLNTIILQEFLKQFMINDASKIFMNL